MKETPMLAQGQVTQAVAAMMGSVPAARPATRKRRAKPATRRKKTTAKRKTTRRAAPKGRLKKGSPAAKARMAKLRAMRKRKR